MHSDFYDSSRAPTFFQSHQPDRQRVDSADASCGERVRGVGPLGGRLGVSVFNDINTQVLTPAILN